jgi:ribosomal protein L16 Arg81 hydroxylase
MGISRSRKRSTHGRHRARGRISLSDTWRAWIVDNALREVPPATLVATLVGGGVSLHVAHREVSDILASAGFAAAVAERRRARRLELLARLLREHAAAAPAAHEIDCLSTIDAPTFYRHYFAAGRPLLLPGFTRDWPAHGRWSPADFEARFAEAEIEIMADRDADPRCDRDFERHRRRVRMGDYLQRIQRAGTSNDEYLVAHNHALSHPALKPLLDEVRPPEELFDPADLARAVSLWIGPAGTRTPLHHDTTSILFCQMWGRKRFWLVSALETALLDGADGFYAAAGAEEIEAGRRPELASVRVLRADLEPGDALFLPAGTWHEVLALDVSISFSLMGFRRPNDVGWYHPGSV